MSLAQTVTVRKSRTQTLIMLGMALLFLITAGLLPTGKIGTFSCYAGYWLPVLFIIIAACLIFQWHRQPAGYTLTVTQDVDFIIADTAADEDTGQAIWHIQPDSTIWTAVIILRLKDEARRKTCILFPDAVGVQAFHQLYVTCRWKLTHLYTGQPQQDRNL